MKKEFSIPALGAVAVPLLMLLMTGCSKTEEAGDNPGGQMAGPGGGGFEPVASTASASEIFQQKCQGCHGDRGQGARGPALTKTGDRANSELHTIIHDGHNKMPAFATQMTDAQIDALVAYVKQLSTAK